MNWYTIFYLFSVADRLSTFFALLGVACAIGLVLTFMGIENYHPNPSDVEHNTRLRKWRPWFISISLLCFSFAVFTPSKKDLLLIIAGGAVGDFVTSDSSAKALPSDITRFLRGQILKATADLKEDIAFDGERDKLKQLSQEELVNLLMQEKAKQTNQP